MTAESATNGFNYEGRDLFVLGTLLGNREDVIAVVAKNGLLLGDNNVAYLPVNDYIGALKELAGQNITELTIRDRDIFTFAFAHAKSYRTAKEVFQDG